MCIGWKAPEFDEDEEEDDYDSEEERRKRGARAWELEVAALTLLGLALTTARPWYMT
jgi:hypothetical protein